MRTLLRVYVYQVFGLANVKALMQTGDIKFITVPDVPSTQLLVSKKKKKKNKKKNKFRNTLLFLSLWLPKSTRYPPERNSQHSSEISTIV